MERTFKEWDIPHKQKNINSIDIEMEGLLKGEIPHTTKLIIILRTQRKQWTKFKFMDFLV